MAAFSCRFLKGEVDRLLRKRAGPFSSKRAEIESLCRTRLGMDVVFCELGEDEGTWDALKGSKSRKKQILFSVFV